MRTTFKTTAFIGLVAIFALAFTACPEADTSEKAADQSETITFGTDNAFFTTVTGNMTNSDWAIVLPKIQTAFATLATNGDGFMLNNLSVLFGDAYPQVAIVKKPSYSYYKLDTTTDTLCLNESFVLGATPADILTQIAAAVNAVFGSGPMEAKASPVQGQRKSACS